MDTTNLTPRLDAAIAAYLTHYRALCRGYDQEEWVLGLMCGFQCIAATCYDLIAARLPI
jgi:hypothetical protein